MDKWTLELYNADKEEWVMWTRDAALEEILDTYFSFRCGEFGSDYTQARIMSPVKER